MAIKADVRKEEVEGLLGCGITDDQFTDALRHAYMKQGYLCRGNGRAAAMQHGYLVKLAAGYARDLALSRLAMDLWELYSMEKEHPAKALVPKNGITIL